MKSNRYVTIEEYQYLVQQLNTLASENLELKSQVSAQAIEISELKEVLSRSQSKDYRTESNYFRSSVSSRLISNRSGSVQSYKSTQPMFIRTSNTLTIAAILQEIEKAEQLKQKTYEDLTYETSPTKILRLKSIIDRWDTEISLLKSKKKEIFG
jgi:hypothetical protein